MNKDEKFLARILFANRLLRANNTAFQQLFWAVLRAKHGQDFVEVRPQGAIGDGGNDGYLPGDGHYFQVYGPIDPSAKVDYAAGKLSDDFQKVLSSWNQITAMKTYSFVFNDKYEGTYTRIAQALGKIELANPLIKCRPYTAGHLEGEFLNLSEDRIQSIVGMIPDPTRILTVDYGVMKEVIAHIMHSPAKAVQPRFEELPDLDEKIRLNYLCKAWGDLIRSGARQTGHVDDYFRKNSTFMKQALRDHLVEIYAKSRDDSRLFPSIPSGMSLEDLVFDGFRRALLPDDATVAAERVVDILIGYYFESCGVFDPHAPKDSPNASP